MKQATAGSGSAADKSYPDTAAANAELEAKLTGGNTGGAGSAMPNEAQVRVAGSSGCKDANCMHRPALFLKFCLTRGTPAIFFASTSVCSVLAEQNRYTQSC